MPDFEPSPQPVRSPQAGDLAAISLGASVLLWATAYVWLAPAVDGPAGVLAGIVGLILLGVGFLVGRLTTRGVRGGVVLGLFLGLINFIIVASLHGKQTTSAALIDGMKWVAGFTIVAIVLGALGALIGSTGRATPRPRNWTGLLALILALTTLALLVSGGIVTGLEAGLAVPDWLTTFRYPMMFYPMKEMLKNPGVYAEHFHRLWGLLVGLATIIFVVHIHRLESRRWLKRLSLAILLAVIVQGVLGGFGRVLQKEIWYAVAHGVFGQIVFVTIVSLVAFSSGIWKSDRAPMVKASAPTDRTVTTLLPLALLVQLALGAMYRHLGHVHVLYTHILMAAVVTGLAIFAAGRAWGGQRDLPVVPRLGKSVLHTVGAQIVLGVLALIAVWSRLPEEPIPALEVVVTTMHQVTGAVLFALSVLLMLWTRRLLAAAPSVR